MTDDRRTSPNRASHPARHPDRHPARRGAGRPAAGTARRPARSRALLVALLLAAFQLTALISPAWACGCGAAIPGPGTTFTVHRETSAISFDGRREQIVMSFDVYGTAEKAAWIMPVPSRADVTLGDSALFSELNTAAEPEYRVRHYFWPRSGDWPFTKQNTAADGAPRPSSGAPPVGVVGRQRLGDFDVARLTATDPNALGDWLHRNGFQLPADLGPALKPYVDEGWEYVAVRLAPAKEAGDRAGTRRALYGELTPLRITFDSDRLVYPMRLSRLAKTPQELRLYVLTDHRVRTSGTIGGDPPETEFAGRLDTGTLAPDLIRRATPAGTGPYLTVISQRFPKPARINADHVLRRTAADTPFRQVYYVPEISRIGGVPTWIAAVAGFLLLLVIAVVTTALLLLARGRRAVRPDPLQDPPDPAEDRDPDEHRDPADDPDAAPRGPA